MSSAGQYRRDHRLDAVAGVFAQYLEGEYAWNVHRAELETAGMLGNLFGWDPVKTGAIYT